MILYFRNLEWFKILLFKIKIILLLFRQLEKPFYIKISINLANNNPEINEILFILNQNP